MWHSDSRAGAAEWTQDPMALPLRLRHGIQQPVAQEQYHAFRDTPFAFRQPDGRGSPVKSPSMSCFRPLGHGHVPSVLEEQRREKNTRPSPRATKSKQRGITLYKMERNGNHDTTTPVICDRQSVDRIYDVHNMQCLQSFVDQQGNTATCLKSASPRFGNSGSSALSSLPQVGPGCYHSERFVNGAFPCLQTRVTPQQVHKAHQSRQHRFEQFFEITCQKPVIKRPSRPPPPLPPPLRGANNGCAKIPKPTALPPSALIKYDQPARDDALVLEGFNDPDDPLAHQVFLDSLAQSAIRSTRLVAALTPRIAYNRQLFNVHEYMQTHGQDHPATEAVDQDNDGNNSGESAVGGSSDEATATR